MISFWKLSRAKNAKCVGWSLQLAMLLNICIASQLRMQTLEDFDLDEGAMREVKPSEIEAWFEQA